MKKSLCLMVLAGLLSAAAQVWACSALVVENGDQVLVGNNEDYFKTRTKMWFIQPTKNWYGAVFFGFDDYLSQGGMNQKGLVCDSFSVPPHEVKGQEGKRPLKGNLFKKMMLTCATTQEALDLITRYDLSLMENFQVLLADANGDAAIVEGDAVIRKTGPYQIVTNFRQSQTPADDITCQRYLIARDMLENSRAKDLSLVRRILAATHHEAKYPTQYSNIYDLKARKIYLYHFHNYQEEVVIDLEKELANQSGAVNLPDLFPPNYAARLYTAEFTDLKKTYTHASPRFAVSYPEIYDSVPPTDEDQVFMARNSRGHIPVLTVYATEAAPKMDLSLVAGEYYIPRMLTKGSNVRVESNQPATLADGTPAYESRLSWRWSDGTHLNTLALSVIKDGKLISVGLHNDGELDYLKHIPYSLSFE